MTFLPHITLGDFLIMLVAGMALAGVAALLIAIGWYSWQKVKASQSWPSVPGTVLAAGLDTSSSGEGGTVYRAVVRYGYAVGGQDYQNDRWAFGASVSDSNPRGAEQTVARYPAGSSVLVYYNPANPQEAVLERVSRLAGLLFGMGGLFLLLGCGLPTCGFALYLTALIGPAISSSPGK